MTIGIIDNFDSFVFNLVRYVRECDGVTTIVQRNNAIDYAILDTCDALLLSPGPGIPDEAGELKNIIRRYSGKKNILGVCLGHQAIAEVFGGKLESCSAPIHGKSSSMKLHGNESMFQGLADTVEVGRYHSWQVCSDQTGELEITATATDGSIMALKHPIHATKGVQFHPESILTPTGRTMITNWINEVR